MKNPTFVKPSHRFNEVATHIVGSLFEPLSVFVPVEAPGKGRYERVDRKYTWGNLKRDIFNATHLDEFWTRREFREAADLVVEVWIIMEKVSTDGRANCYRDVAWNFLFDDLDAKTKAVECLIEVVATFRDHPGDSDEEDLDDILLTLVTINSIQKSGGLLLVQDEEEDEAVEPTEGEDEE